MSAMILSDLRAFDYSQSKTVLLSTLTSIKATYSFESNPKVRGALHEAALQVIDELDSRPKAEWETHKLTTFKDFFRANPLE